MVVERLRLKINMLQSSAAVLIAIKADIDLCHSYEGLLETLVFGHYEKAAALLDEFRIH